MRDLVLNLHALLLGCLQELAQLPSGRCRPHVTGGHHRYQDSHAFEALDEHLLEDIIALQLGVPPDPGRLAEQLCQTPIEPLMQLRHPPFLVFVGRVLSKWA